MNISSMNANVPQEIRRIIQEKGLKQKAVAERSGISPQAFSEIMNGRKLIKACDISQIANALGVSPSELFPTHPTHPT